MSGSLCSLKVPVAKNVIWIVVDSVRNYHTDADDRGRIEVIDKLAEKAIEFETAVTSAPSTVMSTSAMMTGVPAIFHSKTYNDFDFKYCGIKSLPLILEKEGYNVYNVIFFPEGRDFLGPMLGNICKDHWPKYAKANELWDNDTVNDILSNLLRAGIKEPFFLFLNYNCRHDPQTSDKVEYGLKILEEHGLMKEVVLILNSDHGYPDASREITFFERRKFGHDLIMTDDNILTPLIISYPGCRPKTIEKPVSLLDVMPTVLDIIGRPDLYEVSGLPSYGRSLMSLIEGREDNYNPTVRVDNRYIFQDGRMTALRSEKYKYVYSFDDKIEEFYDLVKDPKEQNDLSEDSEYISTVELFRENLFKQEELIYAFHEKRMRERCEAVFQKKYRSVIFLGWPHRNFIKMIVGILLDYGIKRLFVFENNPSNKEPLVKVLKDVEIKTEIVDEVISIRGTVDLALTIFTDNDPRKKYLIRKLAERLRPRHIVYANYNLKVHPSPPFWLKPLLSRFFRTMLPRLKKNPKESFVKLIILARRVFFKYKI